ncbi:hypothetical protein MKS88_004753 [Plasmodium brasilianum]|uniref:Uncharacterized protein n=1 Tax=Plasmodium brasilianum TaxID=5824 RepID=A0ACB9Y4C6_PLABR|nr:hypothetical protein MKS88_004753 [Plasmodium brasilianum]
MLKILYLFEYLFHEIETYNKKTKIKSFKQYKYLIDISINRNILNKFSVLEIKLQKSFNILMLDNNFEKICIGLNNDNSLYKIFDALIYNFRRIDTNDMTENIII